MGEQKLTLQFFNDSVRFVGGPIYMLGHLRTIQFDSAHTATVFTERGALQVTMSDDGRVTSKPARLLDDTVPEPKNDTEPDSDIQQMAPSPERGTSETSSP